MNDNQQNDAPPAAAPATDQPDKVTVQLSRPIRVAGQETRELTLHEPTLRHYEALDKLGLTFQPDGSMAVVKLGSLAFTAVQLLGGLTAKEAAAISMRDLGSIAGAVLGFFDISLPTGGTE